MNVIGDCLDQVQRPTRRKTPTPQRSQKLTDLIAKGPTPMHRRGGEALTNTFGIGDLHGTSQSQRYFNNIGVRTSIHYGAPKLDIKMIACSLSCAACATPVDHVG